jgi:hypothetical protein
LIRIISVIREMQSQSAAAPKEALVWPAAFARIAICSFLAFMFTGERLGLGT